MPTDPNTYPLFDPNGPKYPKKPAPVDPYAGGSQGPANFNPYDPYSGLADRPLEGGMYGTPDPYAEQRKAEAAVGANQAESRGYMGRARTDELAQEDAIRQAMLGQGPSVAEQQLKRGQESAMQQALAMAASARGGNVQAAQRQATYAQAGLSQQASAAAAELRAKEQMQARSELTQAILERRKQELLAMGLDEQQAEAMIQRQIAEIGGANAAAEGAANRSQRNMELMWTAAGGAIGGLAGGPAGAAGGAAAGNAASKE